MEIAQSKDMMCPVCGRGYSLPDRFFNKDCCQCKKDGVDLFLEIGSSFDLITPVIQLGKELYQWTKK